MSELSVLSTDLSLAEGVVSQLVRAALPTLVSELGRSTYDSHSKNKPWVKALRTFGAKTPCVFLFQFEDICADLDTHVYKNGDVGRKLLVLLKACFPHVLREEDVENNPLEAPCPRVALDESPLRKVTSGKALQEAAIGQLPAQ